MPDFFSEPDSLKSPAPFFCARIPVPCPSVAEHYYTTPCGGSFFCPDSLPFSENRTDKIVCQKSNGIDDFF